MHCVYLKCHIYWFKPRLILEEITRMYSSRMRTARSSSRPWGVPHPPGADTPDQAPPAPCGQNAWHTLLKILLCPKLRLRAVKISIIFIHMYSVSLLVYKINSGSCISRRFTNIFPVLNISMWRLKYYPEMQQSNYLKKICHPTFLCAWNLIYFLMTFIEIANQKA